jgi:hypothetical protein
MVSSHQGRNTYHQAFLCASSRHSRAPTAGERHGRAMMVVPVSWTTNGPMELHGSAGHHQVPASMSSVRHASSSVGRCGRGDEEAVSRFESTASLSRAGGSTLCVMNWARGRHKTEFINKWLSTHLQNRN